MTNPVTRKMKFGNEPRMGLFQSALPRGLAFIIESGRGRRPRKVFRKLDEHVVKKILKNYIGCANAMLCQARITISKDH